MHPRTVLLFTLLSAMFCPAQVITTVVGSSSGTSGSDGDGGSVPGSVLRPARAGETLVIYGTGLGLVSPSIATGAASTDALRRTIIKTTVLMGGKSAEVSFSGLSPQFVGVYQINAVVPSGVRGTVPLQLDLSGVRSNDKVTIAIAKP